MRDLPGCLRATRFIAVVLADLPLARGRSRRAPPHLLPLFDSPPALLCRHAPQPAPPARYTGPHLKEPWTLEQADSLLDFYVQQFTSGKDQVHISYAEDVVAAGIDMFRQLPTLVRVRSCSHELAKGCVRA